MCVSISELMCLALFMHLSFSHVIYWGITHVICFILLSACRSHYYVVLIFQTICRWRSPTMLSWRLWRNDGAVDLRIDQMACLLLYVEACTTFLFIFALRISLKLKVIQLKVQELGYLARPSGASDTKETCNFNFQAKNYMVTLRTRNFNFIFFTYFEYG